MSDNVQLKGIVTLHFLKDEKDEDNCLAIVYLSDVTVTIPVNSHRWNDMEHDDRQSWIDDILWERCRVYFENMEEI